MDSAKSVQEWGWVVAGGNFIDEFMAEVVELRNVFVAASIVCTILVIGLTFVVVKVQLGPLKLIGTLMERIGNGDLTANAEWETLGASADSCNEIRLLAHRMQVMLKLLRELILSVGSSVKTLSEALDGVSNVCQVPLLKGQGPCCLNGFCFFGMLLLKVRTSVSIEQFE